MASRLYSLAVVLFWLSTMTWLVVSKVAPALQRGDPPDHRAAVIAQEDQTTPVVWDIQWDHRHIGWAASLVQDLPGSSKAIHSRIEFTDLPQHENNITSWLIQQIAQLADVRGDFKLRVHNRSEISANGSLVRIDSAVYMSDAPKSLPWLRMTGSVGSDMLELKFLQGDRGTPLIERSIPIRRQAMISNEMSPRGYMPPLKLHQQWTDYQVSALRPPTSSQKLVTAKVERFEPIVWNGRVTETLLVVYREDAGAGSQSKTQHLGKVWVRPKDGMVLQQEIVVYGTRLTFVRRNEEETRRLAKDIDQRWPLLNFLDTPAGQQPEDGGGTPAP